MVIWNNFIYFCWIAWSLGRPDFGQILLIFVQKCDYFFILKAMCPLSVSPLLRLAKTKTAIYFAWISEMISAIFVALFSHLRRMDFGQILLIFAQKVRLFLYFEGHVPPKCFPAASPCEDEHGNMLCKAIWNDFIYLSWIAWSFRAAGFRTNFTHFRPKSAIISLFWMQCAPKMFPRCFALWRRSRQHAQHGHLK